MPRYDPKWGAVQRSKGRGPRWERRPKWSRTQTAWEDVSEAATATATDTVPEVTAWPASNIGRADQDLGSKGVLPGSRVKTGALRISVENGRSQDLGPETGALRISGEDGRSQDLWPRRMLSESRRPKRGAQHLVAKPDPPPVSSPELTQFATQ